MKIETHNISIDHQTFSGYTVYETDKAPEELFSYLIEQHGNYQGTSRIFRGNKLIGISWVFNNGALITWVKLILKIDQIAQYMAVVN